MCRSPHGLKYETQEQDKAVCSSTEDCTRDYSQGNEI